jgi:hypothetical protein
MPVAYAGYMGDDVPTSPATKTPVKEATQEISKGSVKPKKLDVGSQRKFLHGALQVIGTELDNQPDALADGFGYTPHPQGSRIDHQAAAWEVREQLRKRYAKHTDSEIDQLEAAVQAKEQEVVSLRKQVDQMERYLAATNAAAARRVHRLQAGNKNTNEKEAKGSAAVASAVKKTQNRFLSSAMINNWDADDGVARSTRENVIEEWQHEIMRQGEKAQSMRAHVDEQVKLHQQQTVQRKAKEAALFASQTQTLKLRHQTHAMEARVQRLANELKRVYNTLPDMIQVKLSTDGNDMRKQHKEFELRALRVEHHGEFFKFLDPVKIQEETESCQNRIAEIEEHTVLAQEVLERGKWFAESGVQHAKNALTSMNALHERYSRFEQAGHPALQLTIKDANGNESNDADCILQRATLSVNALTELIEILHQGDSLVEFAACETMNWSKVRARMQREDRDREGAAAEKAKDMGRASTLMMEQEMSDFYAHAISQR